MSLLQINKNKLRNQHPQLREKTDEIPSAWDFRGEGPLILLPATYWTTACSDKGMS